MGAPDFTEFETLKHLVAAGREREGSALDVRRRPAPYSYHKFSTNVWKAGNLFGHYGVHTVGRLAVAVGPKSRETDASGSNGSTRDGWGRLDAAEPLLAILGGTIVGASVDLTPSEPVDAPALVAPAHWDIDVTPSCTQLAYGGPPDDPAVTHFERSVWSENPIEPPEQVDPADVAVSFDGEQWTHENLLAGVAELVEEHGIDADSSVVLATDITEPGGLLAGVLTPLAVGATIVVPEKEAAAPGDVSADTFVVSDESGGENVVSAADVTRSMRDIRRA